MSLQPQLPSRHRWALPKRKREPASNQAQPTQWRDWSEELEPRWVQDKSVDASAEHGHSSCEEAGSKGVVTGNEEGDRVDELCY